MDVVAPGEDTVVEFVGGVIHGRRNRRRESIFVILLYSLSLSLSKVKWIFLRVCRENLKSLCFLFLLFFFIKKGGRTREYPLWALTGFDCILHVEF